MTYLARMFAFFAVLCLPALALAQGMGALPFDPFDVQVVAQRALELVLSGNYTGLAAVGVIVAVGLVSKFQAKLPPFFGTGLGKVVLALVLSIAGGLSTLALSATPFTVPVVLTVLTKALAEAFLGIGAVRAYQKVRGEEAAQAAEAAGAAAVKAALGAAPSRAQVVAITDKGGV